MPGPKSRKATSQAQRRFLGAVASGTAKSKPKSLSRKEARDMLKASKGKKLPKRAKGKR